MLWSSIHITYSILYTYNMYKMYLFQDVWVTVVRSSNLMIHNVTSVPGASQGVCFCSYFRPWQRPNYTICRWGWAIWVAPTFAKASAQGRCWSRLWRAFLQLLGTWIFSWKLGEFWMTKKITCNLETVDSMTLQQWCFFWGVGDMMFVAFCCNPNAWRCKQVVLLWTPWFCWWHTLWGRPTSKKQHCHIQVMPAVSGEPTGWYFSRS